MREGGSGVTSRGNREKWRRGRRRALGEEKVEKQGLRRPFLAALLYSVAAGGGVLEGEYGTRKKNDEG